MNVFKVKSHATKFVFRVERKNSSMNKVVDDSTGDHMFYISDRDVVDLILCGAWTIIKENKKPERKFPESSLKKSDLMDVVRGHLTNADSLVLVANAAVKRYILGQEEEEQEKKDDPHGWSIFRF